MREIYQECLRLATACARVPAEAGDLVQAVLLYAYERGITDLDHPERRAWLRGALRRRAAFDARLAGRRRTREASWFIARGADQASSQPWQFSTEFIARLQPSIRALATLASSDLNSHEIRAILRLSATAFRKRLSLLRDASDSGLTVVNPRSTAYALGPARSGVIESLRRARHAVLGSHDPDGHVLIFAMHQQKTESLPAHTPGSHGN
jgi:RNA polymerase sigma-70 factor (ECF subfamily)